MALLGLHNRESFEIQKIHHSPVADIRKKYANMQSKIPNIALEFP
jgi:hypothetical protein